MQQSMEREVIDIKESPGFDYNGLKSALTAAARGDWDLWCVEKAKYSPGGKIDKNSVIKEAKVLGLVTRPWLIADFKATGNEIKEIDSLIAENVAPRYVGLLHLYRFHISKEITDLEQALTEECSGFNIHYLTVSNLSHEALLTRIMSTALIAAIKGEKMKGRSFWDVPDFFVTYLGSINSRGINTAKLTERFFNVAKESNKLGSIDLALTSTIKPFNSGSVEVRMQLLKNYAAFLRPDNTYGGPNWDSMLSKDSPKITEQEAKNMRRWYSDIAKSLNK